MSGGSRPATVRVALDVDATVIDAQARAYPAAVERAGELAGDGMELPGR